MKLIPFFFICLIGIVFTVYVILKKKIHKADKRGKRKKQDQDNNELEKIAHRNNLVNSEITEKEIYKYFKNFLTVNLETIIAKKVVIDNIYFRKIHKASIVWFTVDRNYGFLWNTFRKIILLSGRPKQYSAIIHECNFPHLILKPKNFGISVSTYAMGTPVLRDHALSKLYSIKTSKDKFTEEILTVEVSEYLMRNSQYCLEMLNNAVIAVLRKKVKDPKDTIDFLEGFFNSISNQTKEKYTSKK